MTGATGLPPQPQSETGAASTAPQHGAGAGSGAQHGSGAGAQQGSGAGAQQGSGAGSQQLGAGSQHPEPRFFSFWNIATFLQWSFLNKPWPASAGLLIAKVALNISANAATQLTKFRFIDLS